MKKEIYISTDIEADGPCPGLNSMLSIGSVAFVDYKLVDKFSINLKQLPGSEMNPKTKTEFWDKFPEAWEAVCINPQDPERGIKQYVNWLENIKQKYNGNLIFVGYPLGFDFTFIYYYLMRFNGYSPFSFSGIDMKTLAMALMKKPLKKCTKNRMPKHWFDEIKYRGLTHSHIAVEDAEEQGYLFISMLRELFEK